VMLLVPVHGNKDYIAASEKHSGRLGVLIGPSYYRKPRGMSFALDNDAYINWRNGKDFDEKAWVKLLDKVKDRHHPPMWVLVPDAVGDRQKTLNRWNQYSDFARSYGWPLAFAAQDGMVSSDVPKDADVVFVGGSTSWKWSTVKRWCRDFPRVHVGRVGSLEKLWECESLGAESCDGSGFLREGWHGRRARGIKTWLSVPTDPQIPLFA